jgi:hypothetical protein
VVLTKTDLEKIGIDLLGDQYAIFEELSELKRAARRVLRDQILWKASLEMSRLSALGLILALVISGTILVPFGLA